MAITCSGRSADFGKTSEKSLLLRIRRTKRLPDYVRQTDTQHEFVETKMIIQDRTTNALKGRSL